MSHRPLNTDELFQIRIDNVKSGTEFLLHLGVLLPPGLVRWWFISSHVVLNGTELQRFNKLDIDKLKVFYFFIHLCESNVLVIGVLKIISAKINSANNFDRRDITLSPIKILSTSADN